jgi:hypothetical protein
MQLILCQGIALINQSGFKLLQLCWLSIVGFTTTASADLKSDSNPKIAGRRDGQSWASDAGTPNVTCRAPEAR